MAYNSQDKKPVYNGLISDGEYEAVVVKVSELPPSDYGTAVKVLFLIDNILIGNVPYIYFVSGLYNKSYDSNSRTAKLMAALGQDISGVFPVQGNLVGKKCKIYVEAGPAKYSAKLGREVQYMKVKAVNPINRVVPNPIAPTQEQTHPVQRQQPVQYQPVQPVKIQQPRTTYAVQQGAPAQATPVISTVPPVQGTIPQPSFAQQPSFVQTVPTQSNVAQPVYAPVQSNIQTPAPQQAQPVQVAPRATSNVAPVQVQQAEQPLPTTNYTQDDLDF